MATPIGHAIAAYAVSQGGIRSDGKDKLLFLVLCMFAAVAPDLDFVPGILSGQPALYHQGVSHSFIVGLLVSLIMAGFCRLTEYDFRVRFTLFFLSYISHFILDFFGPDSRPPLGQPLFWPFSMSHYMAPFQIFPGVRHASSTSVGTTEWVSTVLQIQNLKAIGVELLILLPLAMVSRAARNRLRIRKLITRHVNR